MTGSDVNDAKASPRKMNDLFLRLMSALVLAPIVLGAVWYGEWAFALLLAIAAVLMAHEMSTLVFGRERRPVILLSLSAVGGIFLAYEGLYAVALGVVAGGLLLSLSARLWSRKPLWPSFIAYPYVGLPLIALLWLRADAEYGLAVIIWLLATVWAIDIFAYFAGRFIGGPKLAPRISPKKTWAGLLGGMAGAIVVAIVTNAWLGQGSALWLCLVAVCVTIIEQAGDFAESALKRRAEVKDSGSLIPGHGGILDRVDGLVAVSIACGILALIHNLQHPAAGVLIWP